MTITHDESIKNTAFIKSKTSPQRIEAISSIKIVYVKKGYER